MKNNYRLVESRTKSELLDLLQTKLGCLSDTSNASVESLFNKDMNRLTSKATKTLENISAGKIKRQLKTKYLSKIWITLRGANAKIRNLDEKKAGYIFLYFESGEIIEGKSNTGLYSYTLGNIKAEDVKILQNRFEKSINLAKTLNNGQCLQYKVENGASKKGEAVVYIAADKSSDLAGIQNIFRENFAKEESSIKKALVNFARKAFKNASNLFAKDNRKEANLKGIVIDEGTTIEMDYTKEEKDLAKEVLTVFSKSKKSNKKSKQITSVVSNPKDLLDLDNSDKNIKDDPDKVAFSQSSLGNRLRRKNYIQKHPNTYKNVKAATDNLDKKWNQKDASTILAAAGEAIEGSGWTDKKKLGNVLRQVDLVESD